MRAIVTGASSGIGQSIYSHLQTHGMDVVGISRRGPDAFVDFDVEEAGYFSRVEPVDHLVLNHGMMPLEEYEAIDQILRVNFLSFYHTLYLQALHGKPVKPRGSILIIASVAGVTGDEDVPFYASLKAGLLNLVRSYAPRLWEQRIRINAISPGFVKTNLVPGDPPEELINEIPMGREASPNELLPAVDFLLRCEYVTGQNVIIDGGSSL